MGIFINLLAIFLFSSLVDSLGPPLLIPFPKEINYSNKSVQIDPCLISFELPSLIPQYYQDILSFNLKKTFQKNICDIKRMLFHFKGQRKVRVEVDEIEDDLTIPSQTTDESYELDVSLENTWTLKSKNYYGFIRGLETFLQLIEPLNDITEDEFKIACLPVSIRDKPDFSYRGIMLDTSRHFLSKDVLKRTLDGMMFNKLNVLHWHITDSESFPLILNSFPELAKFGAYSSKKVFTMSDVKEIIEYAKFRGIRVIPEIDAPGHTLCWGLWPEFSLNVIKCGGYSGQLDPTTERTYEIMKGVLNDLAENFQDEFIHLGGDEVQFDCWLNMPNFKEFMNKNNFTEAWEAQNYFKNQAKSILPKNKRTIFWVDNQKSFEYAPDDILQFWGGTNQYNLINNVTNLIILSPVDILYIDIGYGNLFGDDSWKPMSTWKNIYQFNPLPKEVEKGTIIGAEVTLWGELNSESTTDNHLWSRASAFAERMWNSDIDRGLKDVVFRLYGNEERMRRRGFQVSPITSEYCARHVEDCFDN